MEQYIKKSEVIAEIKKLIDNPAPSHDQQCPWEDGYYCGLYKAESIIDTLEVKEVDDEKCKEYDKALSIAKAWYKSSDSSAQERNVARMIMGDNVRE